MRARGRGGEGARGRVRRSTFSVRRSALEVLAILSVVCCLLSPVYADWKSDERMIASVTLPRGEITLSDLCTEMGAQTSSEFYVDRRHADDKIAWQAGETKLSTAMSAVESATGLQWRMVGDMFFLTRDANGVAVTNWIERYAQAKKAAQAGVARKQVKEWVHRTMPFPAKVDAAWELTPLQSEQLAYQQSLLLFTMTPPQLNWLNSVLKKKNFPVDEGQTIIQQLGTTLPEIPVKSSAGMLVHGPSSDFLVEMTLVGDKPEEAPSAKPVKVTPETAEAQEVKTVSFQAEDFRGLWITEPDTRNLQALLAKAKMKGFKALFFPAFESGHALYSSASFPQYKKGSDPLKDACRIAGGMGIGVHAVIESTLWGDADYPAPEAAANRVLQDCNLLGRTYGDEEKWQQSELKALSEGDGTVTDEDKKVYLCPASSQLPRLLRTVANEIAVGYPVAGLCLDGVDYARSRPFVLAGENLAPPFGYTLEVRRDVIRLDQIDPIDIDPQTVRNAADADALALWDKFRRGKLTGLVNEVATAFKTRLPDAVFSARLDLTSDAASPAHWSKVFGLDVLIAPMAIRKQSGADTFTCSKEDEEAVSSLHRAVLKNAVVLPAVVGLDSDSLVDQVSALGEAVKAVGDNGLKGFILQGDSKTLSSALDMLE